MSSVRSLSSSRIEIVDFEQQAAFFRLERSVPGAGRPRGIGVGLEGLATFALFVVADREIARNQINFFPIFVHERLGREDARLETQQPRTRALLVLLVERAQIG